MAGPLTLTQRLPGGGHRHAAGHGGQVLLSETAAALVRDVIAAGAALTDLGAHRLKDLGRPERIFQLQAPGLQADFPPLRSLANPALLNNLPAQPSTFIGRDRERTGGPRAAGVLAPGHADRHPAGAARPG